MKQFKNAVAVAIAAAGLYSVSAMAGTAVHWAESDAGSAKDVKWQVVQPSVLDFTLTTTDVQSLSDNGSVNLQHGQSPSRGGAGTWNNADYAYVSAQGIGADRFTSAAAGDQGGETLLWQMYHEIFGQEDLSGADPVFSGKGFLYGKITDSGGSPITDITKVKSSKFTDHITVTKFTD